MGGWIEENVAVGMSYCELRERWVGGWVDVSGWVGRWVGGWETDLAVGAFVGGVVLLEKLRLDLLEREEILHLLLLLLFFLFSSFAGAGDGGGGGGGRGWVGGWVGGG